MGQVSVGLRQALIEAAIVEDHLDDLDLEEFSAYIGRLQSGQLVPVHRWEIPLDRIERWEGGADDWLLLGHDDVLRTPEQVDAELAADADAGHQIWGEEQLFTFRYGVDRG